MTEQAVASEDAVATTPLLLKVIAVIFIVFPLAGLLFFIFGHLPKPPDPVPDYIAFIDHSLIFAILSTELAGAVLLWQLRRTAFTFFASALTLGILNSCWLLFIRGWVGALQPAKPALTYTSLRGAVIGLAVLLNVCVYIWRLRTRGLLK